MELQTKRLILREYTHADFDALYEILSDAETMKHYEEPYDSDWAAFCLLCDLIARSLFAPTELSISSVTAVFGAPVVIWLLVRRQTQEGRE